MLDVVQGKLTWIIGTIYMDMPLKPQVLHDLTADINLASAVPLKEWRDPRHDSIQLEDESGRLTLIGHKLRDQVLCTGIVLAVLGTESASGEFDVIDVLYPTHVENLLSNSIAEDSHAESDKTHSGNATLKGGEEFVAIVSGLEVSDTEQTTFRLDLLSEYLTGELFGHDSHHGISRVGSLIILGNYVGHATLAEQDAMTRKLSKNKKYGYDSTTFDPRPIEILDLFLEEICRSIDIVLIPGEQDPTNITLPQKPINKIMLQASSKYTNSTLRLASNPSYLHMSSRTIFCTAGQTIDDLKHYIITEDVQEDQSGIEPSNTRALDLAQETIKWGHFAPTAPDTLWTYPFADRDPFIIEHCPDVYLIGNQESFDRRTIRTSASNFDGKCSLVQVPRFSTTGQLVLLNLKTLESEIINFSTQERRCK